jgi:hypothetical protein
MKKDTIIYWVRSSGGGKPDDLVPMYFKGRLMRDTDEGRHGDIQARPVRLGKGPYVATYGGDDFVDREGRHIMTQHKRSR